MASLLGISVLQWDGDLTLSRLAGAKGIPEEFLASLGVADGFVGTAQPLRPCVDIPYCDERGEVVAVRKRLSLEGPTRFIWRRGDRTWLYGLPRLIEIRRLGWVVLVEGETDCWILWHHRIPALGVPGASNWKLEFAAYLEGLEIYTWHEGDAAGDQLAKAVASSFEDVKVVEDSTGAKDPSELYLQAGDRFKETVKDLLKAARPMSELRLEAFTQDARDLLLDAGDLLKDPGFLDRFSTTIRAMGFAGNPRPAIMGT